MASWPRGFKRGFRTPFFVRTWQKNSRASGSQRRSVWPDGGWRPSKQKQHSRTLILSTSIIMLQEALRCRWAGENQLEFAKLLPKGRTSINQSSLPRSRERVLILFGWMFHFLDYLVISLIVQITPLIIGHVIESSCVL